MAKTEVITHVYDCTSEGVILEFVNSDVKKLVVRRIKGTIVVIGRGNLECIINGETDYITCKGSTGYNTLDDKNDIYRYESVDGQVLSYLKISIPIGAKAEISGLQ